MERPLGSLSLIISQGAYMGMPVFPRLLPSIGYNIFLRTILPYVQISMYTWIKGESYIIQVYQTDKLIQLPSLRMLREGVTWSGYVPDHRGSFLLVAVFWACERSSPLQEEDLVPGVHHVRSLKIYLLPRTSESIVKDPDTEMDVLKYICDEKTQCRSNHYTTSEFSVL